MREKEKSTRVIFVRHGQADFPHDRLYCDDREDPGLAPAGKQQAEGAATLLADEHLDVLIASPMRRTQMTAEAIVRKTQVPMKTDARLKERPFGIWDGLYFDEIARDYPEGFKAWKTNPVEFVPEGGETIRDHHQRIISALNEHLETHAGETIVITAHVGPIRMCICDAMGIPLANYRQLSVDYGSLTRIDYGRRQNNLIYLNRQY